MCCWYRPTGPSSYPSRKSLAHPKNPVSPLELTLTRFWPVSPLFLTLTKSLDLKSLVFILFQKSLGGGPPRARFLPLLYPAGFARSHAFDELGPPGAKLPSLLFSPLHPSFPGGICPRETSLFLPPSPLATFFLGACKIPLRGAKVKTVWNRLPGARSNGVVPVLRTQVLWERTHVVSDRNRRDNRLDWLRSPDGIYVLLDSGSSRPTLGGKKQRPEGNCRVRSAKRV